MVAPLIILKKSIQNLTKIIFVSFVLFVFKNNLNNFYKIFE